MFGEIITTKSVCFYNTQVAVRARQQLTKEIYIYIYISSFVIQTVGRIRLRTCCDYIQKCEGLLERVVYMIINKVNNQKDIAGKSKYFNVYI